MHVSIRRGVDLDDFAWVARITNDVKQLGIRFLVLDAARRLSVKTDEGPTKVRELTAVLRTLVTQTGVTIAIVHHDTKPPATGQDQRRRSQRASGGDWFAAEGFFERHQYEGVRRRLDVDLQVAVSIAYTFGWRMQSEVLPLERRHLDLEAGTLRLDAGTTKNDDGRVVYLTPELKVMLAAQLERIEGLQRRLGRIIPVLFPHGGKGARAGKPRRDFRKAWATACKDAGVVGRFRHDFRRTAVRNLVNAGVPERVAMTITGHRTRSVFDRYHIVSPTDLQEATRRLAGTIRAQSSPEVVDTPHVTP